jgi:hypothetical protein
VPFCYFTFIKIWKADLFHMYRGVAPKMAEEAHPLAIDQVWLLPWKGILQHFVAFKFM